MQLCSRIEIYLVQCNVQEQALQTKESLSENMEAIKRKFEQLITDLAANAHIRDDINKMADEMIKSGHSEKRSVKKRQKEINDRSGCYF